MKEKIKEIMSKTLEIKESQITDESTMQDFKNWDSLRHMNLIVALEEEFNVNFDISKIADMVSFQSILKVVEETFPNS